MYAEELSEKDTERKRKRDADGRVHESRSPGVDDLLQVHSEAEANDRSLQEKFRERAAFHVEVVHGGEPKEKSGSKSEGRGDQAACRQDNADVEKITDHSP